MRIIIKSLIQFTKNIHFQYYNFRTKMLSEQSTIFPKQIKIEDDQSAENNSLIILQSSNLLLGTGSRTSSTAVILAKALHYLKEQGEFNLTGKAVLELGCGVGLVGLYLAALGTNVALCDTPALKDLVQKNININRQMLKGKVQFFIGSWKKTSCLGDCKQGQQSETISTSSSSKTKETCLFHLSKYYDWTLVCECGGLSDLQNQLKFIGRQGLILAFMRRQNWDDGLDERSVNEYLNENMYEYQKMQTFHPEYKDKRISIFKIYPLIPYKDEQEMAQKMQEEQNQSNQVQQGTNLTSQVSKMHITNKIPSNQ